MILAAVIFDRYKTKAKRGLEFKPNFSLQSTAASARFAGGNYQNGEVDALSAILTYGSHIINNQPGLP